MPKRTILELKTGKIEYSNDGETEIYTYNGKTFDELSEDEKAELRNAPEFQEMIKAFNIIAEFMAKVFEEVKASILPVMNHALKMVQEAEAEKAKLAKKKKSAKKGKTDETK